MNENSNHDRQGITSEASIYNLTK